MGNQFFQILCVLTLFIVHSNAEPLVDTKTSVPPLIVSSVNLMSGASVVHLPFGLAAVGGDIPGESVLGVTKAQVNGKVVQSIVSVLDTRLVTTPNEEGLVYRFPAYFKDALLSSGSGYVPKEPHASKLLRIERKGSNWRVLFKQSDETNYWVFSDSGLLIQMVHVDQVTTITHTVQGQLSEIRDPYGNTTRFTPVSNGLRIDFAGNSYEYTLDKSARLTHIRADTAPIVEMFYTKLSGKCGGMLEAILNRIGEGLAFTYGPCEDRVVVQSSFPVARNGQRTGPEAQFDYSGGTPDAKHVAFSTPYDFKRFTFEPGLRLLEILSSMGRVTYKYEGENSKVLPTTILEESRGLKSTTEVTYNELGLASEVIVSGGITPDRKTIDYDPHGLPIKSTSLRSPTIETRRNKLGQVSEVRRGGDTYNIDRNPRYFTETTTVNRTLVSVRVRNPLGLPLSITNALRQKTSFEYVGADGPDGLRGTLAGVTDPMGNTTIIQRSISGASENTTEINTIFGLSSPIVRTSQSHVADGFVLGSDSLGPAVVHSLSLGARSSQSNTTEQPGDGNTWQEETSIPGPSGQDRSYKIFLNGKLYSSHDERTGKLKAKKVPH